jgi:hypothetical protein
MGIFDYAGGFQPATKATAPPLAAAAAKEAQIEQQRQMAENSQLTNNIMGGAYLYNMGMGDNSPIADYLGGLGGGAEAPMMSEGGGAMAVDPATWETGVEGAFQSAPTGEVAGGALPQSAITPDMMAADGVMMTDPYASSAALRAPVAVEGGAIGGSTPVAAGSTTAPAGGAGLATTVGGPLAVLGGYAALQDSMGENESDIAMSIANPMLDVATVGLHRDGGGPIGDMFDDSELEDMFNEIGDLFGGLF